MLHQRRVIRLFLLICINMCVMNQVECAGLGDDNKLLTTVDFDYPHLVSEILTTTSVSCYVTPKDITGDVITVTCPSGCDKVTGKLWGTEVYDESSYICAAAIHDGRISENGGRVTFRKFQNSNPSVGTVSSNISSRSLKKSNSSFVFLNAYEGRQSLYAVTCLTKADFTNEKEYLVICPRGCDIASYGVWGTGVYTKESYICSAAIHAGKIDASEGGRAKIMQRPGRVNYQGSVKNGIHSLQHNWTSSSITIEECPQTLSTLVSVDCSLRASHVVGNIFTVVCPAGCSDSYSHVTGSGPYAESSTVCGAAVHDGIIEKALGGTVTVRKISKLSQFLSLRRNEIHSHGSTKLETAFIFQDSIRSFPPLLKVSCQLSASAIHDTSFTVLCPSDCNKESQIYGTSVYSADSSLCSAAIHSGVIKASHGGSVTVRKVDQKKDFIGSSKNGVTSKSANGGLKDAFKLGGYMEEINSVLTVSCDFTVTSVKKVEFTIQCPKECSKKYTPAVKKMWKNGIFSLKTPVCLAGDVAGKIITIRRVSEAARYSGSFEKYLLHSNPLVVDPDHIGKYVVYEDEFYHPKALSVSWMTKANMVHSNTFTIVCPPRLNYTSDQVYGTDLYTDTSQMCMAALHDGRVNDNGGSVTVRKTLGLPSYYGSHNFGYTSQSNDQAWDTSIVFQNTFYHMATTFTVSCTAQGYMIENQKFGVICPSGCSQNAKIYGNKLYAEQSFICAAAIHAGKITDEGGRVVVQRADASYGFIGTTANGIKSFPLKDYAPAFTLE